MAHAAQLVGLVFLVISGYQVKPIIAGGLLSIKFLDFSNPGGLTATGQCCDEDFANISCGMCDHMFEICINKGTEGAVEDDFTSCQVGTYITGATKDMNSNTFGNTIGSSPNPVVFNVSTWPGTISMTIGVYDEDPTEGQHDLVDVLHTTFTTMLDRSTAHGVKLQNRTVLNLEVSIHCDINYFGQNCETLCISQPGRYVCRVDGAKICNLGRTGKNCESEINHCQCNPCLSRGTCINNFNGFQCSCESGFHGRYCESDINECDGKPCMNRGTCLNTPGSFLCFCHDDRTGSRCASYIYLDSGPIMDNQQINSDHIYTMGTYDAVAVNQMYDFIMKIVEVIYTTSEIGHVQLHHRIHFCKQLSNGTLITRFEFKLTLHARPVPDSVLHYVKDKLLSAEYRTQLPLPLASDNNCNQESNSPTSTAIAITRKPTTTQLQLQDASKEDCNQTMEGNAVIETASVWKEEYWISVVVIPFICIFILVVVVLIVRDRRQHSWKPYLSAVTFSRADENVPLTKI